MTTAQNPIAVNVVTGALTYPAGVGGGSGGGGTATVVNKTTTYTAASGEFVRADATSAGFTVTLPASPSSGDQVGVVKIDSTGNVVTVVAAAKTIDGDANATIVSQWAGGVFEYDGSNWFVSAVTQSGGGADGLGLTPTAVKTSAYTAAASDFVPVDTTSGAVTVTLPAAPADGARVGVKHVIQGSANVVTIARGGSDVFNKTGGSTSLTLTLVNQGSVLQYKSSSAIWYVIADDTPLSGTDARYLRVSNNLSDVTAATARTNLGLGTAATASAAGMNLFLAANYR